MVPSSSLIDRIESIPRRELYFFALYRVLVASLIAALVFSPLSMLVGEPHHPLLAHVVSVSYLPISVALLLWGRNERWLGTIVFWSACAHLSLRRLIRTSTPTWMPVRTP